MTAKQGKMYESLKDMSSAEEVVDLLFDYCGTQLLSSGLYEYLVDEGVIDSEET